MCALPSSADHLRLALCLQFALPRGAYATAVLRELLEDTIWFAGDGDREDTKDARETGSGEEAGA